VSSEALRQDTSNADDVDSQRHRRLAASDYASEIVTLVRACSETSHRPGGAETICPPPPPMAVRLAADLRPSADGSPVRTSLVAGGG